MTSMTRLARQKMHQPIEIRKLQLYNDAIDMIAWNEIVVGKMNQDKCKCTHSTLLEVISLAEFINL